MSKFHKERKTYRDAPYSIKERPAQSEKRRRVLGFITMVKEISPTDPGWGGKGVPATRMEMFATEAQRIEVNAIGKLHGCHSCLTKVETDRDQPWIGDHQPPTALSSAARAELGLEGEIYDGTVKLFPQCDACSISQAATVKRINAEVARGDDPDLSDFGKRLLGTGVRKHRKSIDASGTRVSPPQGLSIQRLGVSHGCHSCGTRFPKDAYHADHNPPVCYTFTHVIKILAWARKNIEELDDLEIHQDFQLLPQCPRCSHDQGGRMSAVAREAKELAAYLGFTVYRE